MWPTYPNFLKLLDQAQALGFVSVMFMGLGFRVLGLGFMAIADVGCLGFRLQPLGVWSSEFTDLPVAPAQHVLKLWQAV